MPAPVPPPKMDELPDVGAALGRAPNKFEEVLVAPNNDPDVFVPIGPVLAPPPKTDVCVEENKPPPDDPAVKGELKKNLI